MPDPLQDLFDKDQEAYTFFQSLPMFVQDRIRAGAARIQTREELSGIEGKIENALSGLERSVLTLYLQGDSYNEISQKIGKQVKSIDNALQRVKRKLEKYLEEENL